MFAYGKRCGGIEVFPYPSAMRQDDRKKGGDDNKRSFDYAQDDKVGVGLGLAFGAREKSCGEKLFGFGG